MFKVIIAGSRGFDNYELLKKRMDKLLQKKKPEDIEIVSGTAKGADSLGERYAKERGYTLKRLPAEWDKYGKRAGYIRNYEMAVYADACVVFWDEESNGTRNMIYSAKVRKIQLRAFDFNGKEIDTSDLKRFTK